MSEILVKNDFQINIDKSTVMRLMDCPENNPVYKEISEEFDHIKEKVLRTITPRAVAAFTEIEEEYDKNTLPKGSKVLYSIITIGDEISQLQNQLFKEEEYLKGMLINAMADACLFAVDNELTKWLTIECKKRNFGVVKRYEAPINIPMEAQNHAFLATSAKKYLGLRITSGLMLDPPKSSCQVYKLTEDTSIFNINHDCSNCDNVNCSVRNVPPVKIIVKVKEQEIILECKERESLLAAMLRGGIYFSAVCGGNGTCGKCKIRVLEGSLPVTTADESYFTKKELDTGYRLSCQAYPTNPCKILLKQDNESEFDITADFKGTLKNEVNEGDKNYAFAVDIGTTTIAVALVGKTSKRVVNTITKINSQRAFGGDVISRMQASIKGKGTELQTCIKKDLETVFKQLIDSNHINGTLIDEVVIAGNTTMIHLLMGFSCESIGVYPFTPVEIGLIRKPYTELFSNSLQNNCMVTILPGISTFVGGDIVSGLYFCGFQETDKINLIIDLGTNGEIGMGNRGKIITTSTAAGPAFEGGNITWGTGSIPGAISNVEIQNEKAVIKTIGNKEPIGICGTGVIETVAELVKNDLIDETGLFVDKYFDSGFLLARTQEEEIAFTQRDVRELQLAKSAIRAGMETLLIHYGITYDKVDTVYLAGGFGFHLDMNKAFDIGMLPVEFKGKIEAVGNSSLGGAVKYLTDENSQKVLEDIVGIAKEIALSNDKNFNEMYLDHMYF